MTIDLVAEFARFGAEEATGVSPLYAALCRIVVDRPTLAEPLRRAVAGQQRANLFFAAVQYLLRGVPDHPLADFYPSLGGTASPDGGLPFAFVDFLGSCRDELSRLCAERLTQTNEPLRAALLRPAFGFVDAALADGRPLALVELGTSAGLLLVPDRYAYRYPGQSFGRRSAPLVLTCDLRGDLTNRWSTVEPVIGSRLGIDLNPIDPADADAVAWLKACIWPEQTARQGRLDLALAEVRAERPELVKGDFRSVLPDRLDAIPDELLPVVFTSNALPYVSEEDRRALVGLLAALGRRRDLAVTFNEGFPVGLRTVTPDPSPFAARQVLGTVLWRSGRPAVAALAGAEPHGAWLSWDPRDLAYSLGD